MAACSLGQATLSGWEPMRYALLQPEPRTWVAVLQEHGAFFPYLTAMCWNRAFRFSCGLRAKDRGWFYRLASFLCFRRNVYRSCVIFGQVSACEMRRAAKEKTILDRRLPEPIRCLPWNISAAMSGPISCFDRYGFYRETWNCSCAKPYVRPGLAGGLFSPNSHFFKITGIPLSSWTIPSSMEIFSASF